MQVVSTSAHKLNQLIMNHTLDGLGAAEFLQKFKEELESLTTEVIKIVEPTIPVAGASPSTLASL